MKHRIIEKKVSPDLWKYPIPIIPEELPVLESEDYEERIRQLWGMPQAAEYDTIIIYGDREHFSNVHYFTDYDSRWEETLLILNRNRMPCILVGNEGIGYVKKVKLPVLVEFYQSFSLMGQPNDSSPFLRELFEKHVHWDDGKIGIIGFKDYDPAKHQLEGMITDVPHYIIETLGSVVPFHGMKNATALMSDCNYGLKHNISAKEIVLFEAAGTKISRGILNCLNHLKPGISEIEASRYCEFDGSPANMHPNINFGETNVALGLNSPTEQERLAYGKPLGIGYGLRGSLVHKCGMYLRGAEDLPEEKKGYVEEFLKPYFSNIVSWYEMLRIGVSCGDIYEMTDRELGLSEFGCTLNPGHLTHTDEWTNSPFQKNSMVKLRPGMALQCDYTVTWQQPFMSAHIEDGLVIADEQLREQVARLAPGCWERIQARRALIRSVLNIDLGEEVLPLSDLSCVCFPYMADTSIVLACE